MNDCRPDDANIDSRWCAIHDAYWSLHRRRCDETRRWTGSLVQLVAAATLLAEGKG